VSSVFLSHAHEDKMIVEHIYGRLTEQYPDVKPWLDTYELIGGDSLTDRIAEGINRADKFIIFLSATSILKPWVLRELRKALALELERNEPFIIPVIIDELPKVPDFLEDKVYIDMRHMTEPEFLRALYAAIKGLRGTDGVSSGGVENLRIVVAKHAPNKVIEVNIVPQYWAEDVAFEIEVSTPYKNTIFAFSKTGSGMGTSIAEEREERIYRVCLPEKKATPDNFFAVGLSFDVDVSSVDVLGVRRWPQGLRKPAGWVFFSSEIPGAG
jgi:hypothetical protein